MKRLVEGLARFQREIFPTKQQLFKSLAEGQSPETLFITCADSRVVPDLILQTAPGDLFICRNAGNLVPPHGEVAGGVSATIEYAVMVLHVKNIIVCGHSDCGALKAALHPEKLKDMPTVASWLKHAETARRVVMSNYDHLEGEELLEAAIQENVLAQLDHMRTHPSVAAAVARGELDLYAWMYCIKSGKMTGYDPEAGAFIPVDENVRPSISRRVRARAQEVA